MDELIKKLVLKMFPELAGGYHLPIFGEVVGCRETPVEGDMCDEFRPKYSVDVQVLNEYGDPDTDWPVLKDVILALPVAGHERGQFAIPDDGTWVELAFAYGSPNRPFIRSVLPNKLTLPTVTRDEQLWQHNSESWQNVDKDGNWTRKTDLKITDESLERVISAMMNTEEYHQSEKTVATDDKETVGATKIIEALGAMSLKSGGSFDVASLGDLRLTTRANAIIRALGNLQETVDGNLQSTVGGTLTSQASGGQRFEAPSTWIGTDNENALKLMSETAQMVINLANILATHTHPDAGVINQGAAVSNVSSAASAIKSRIDSISS